MEESRFHVEWIAAAFEKQQPGHGGYRWHRLAMWKITVDLLASLLPFSRFAATQSYGRDSEAGAGLKSGSNYSVFR